MLQQTARSGYYKKTCKLSAVYTVTQRLWRTARQRARDMRRARESFGLTQLAKTQAVGCMTPRLPQIAKSEMALITTS